MILNLLKNNKILLKDFLGKKEKVFDNKKHILSGSDWLLKSQKETGNGGYSVKFSLVRDWDVAYPETTGYIIETLFVIYSYTNDKKYYDSIIKAGDWLLEIQMKNGSWGDSVKNIPAIFDIGQIIFGLVKLYKITKDEKYINSAIKGADFILENQEKDGIFIRYAFNEQSHTYYSRVSWALLELWKVTKKEKYKKSAIMQLDWVLEQQEENGFFNNSSFFNDGNPVLHTIVYTIRGLYESGKILGEEKYIISADKASNKLLEIYKSGKELYAHFDKNWNTTCKFYCLTGLAQLSIVWQKKYEDTKNKDYLFFSIKLNHFLKQTQNTESKNKNIAGAIKGSYPIWGKYMIGAYPNWATKFFIDALLLEEKIKKEENIDDKDFFVKERFNQEISIFPEFINKEDFRIKEINEIIKNGNNLELLDLGCAKGRYTKYFAEKGYNTYGIDPAELFIDYAKENNNHKNIIEFKVGGATNISYEDKKFDIIIVIEVLQHLDDLEKALKEIKRVLKDDGQLIIIDRNPISGIGFLKPILEKMGKWMYKKNDIFKEKWYLSGKWKKELEKVGFENIQIKSIQNKLYSLDRFYFIKNK